MSTTSSRQEVINLTERSCIKCCVQFAYWIIAQLETISRIAIIEKLPGAFDFSAKDALDMRNSLIDKALSGDVIFKQTVVKIIMEFPDRFPAWLQDTVWGHLAVELGKLDAYCRGGTGHSKARAIAINLGSEGMSRKTIDAHDRRKPMPWLKKEKD